MKRSNRSEEQIKGLKSMEIEVKLFATLRDYLPKGSSRFSCKMEVDRSTRVQDILSRLKIPEEIPKIILINGVHGKREQMLKDGDVLSIFPPVAGG
ncbi:MAG: MoaD/ThiS family protein [Desulfobacterales bacterium]|nr:MoaD/ThiS family protein [Desulfobacterales bacterium]